MSELTLELQTFGRELRAAYALRLERRRRRRRRAAAAAVTVACAVVLAAASSASGLLDLPLDPTKWAVLGGGSVDGGRAEYVHAQNRADGSSSTFVVEHDAGLSPYDAFLLHERVLDAASASSPVPVRPLPAELCTPAELTRAERIALTALAASFPPGTDPSATQAPVDAAVAAAFAGAPCRGLEWAGERARFVYAGVEPESMLMRGAR